jgi:dTDP-4-amino-4,6-dideoxygalactose transaminase
VRTALLGFGYWGPNLARNLHLRLGTDWVVCADADPARRAEVARRYRAAAPHLGWQEDDPSHVYHLCVARPENRASFRRRMPFETVVHYPRAIVDEPAYARFERGPVDNARDWAARCVSLPCNPELAEDEVATVCEAIG